MEHKNKSFSRIKRHQSDKVLRYSIRKYSFGAASVAVAALMFLGTHVVSADVVDGKNQPAIGAPNPNEEKSPLIEPAPTSKNEETKETEKVEVAKETEKPAENNEAVENEPLNNRSNNSASSEKETPASDKVVEKQTLDKSQLQASITKVQELLDKVNKEKAPASTLAAIQADLEKANSVLNNNSLELTQAEIDAATKKLSEKISVLSSMPKANAPEKVVKEGKNTIANTGSHDSRNGRNMGEGARFRADDVRVEGALHDVNEYISKEKFSGGGTSTGERERVIDKTFMTARYSQEDGKKYITYDVYFQNDGIALSGTTRNAFWFYPPRDLLYNVGPNYPVGVVSDAYYERYEKKPGTTGKLSHNSSNFTQVGGRYTVPLIAGKTQDYSSQSLWGRAGGIFQFDGGPSRRNPSQVQQMLKGLKDNPELNSIIRLGNNPNGSLPEGSYSHILTVGAVNDPQNFAYKYHVKMRLKDDVTAEQAKTAGTMAVTAKEGSAFNALQAYVYAARGTSLLAAPTINTLTKYDGTLVSTDRVISGTGVAGATITLTLQDGTTRSIPVNNGGSWSYTLKQNEKLTQNTKQDASIKSPNTISAKQTKNGEESSATSVNVQLARAISIDTPLQAGRDISVKVAHDTGRFYIQVRNAANTATVYEYGVIQENGRWRIENSAAANAIDLKVTDGDNPSEKKITLHVNDSHRKNNIPFTITKDHVVRVRSHHVNGDNNPADPGHENDGWVTANKATNTDPTITINNSNATYTSDGTLTKDKLQTLVTVNDAEDTPGRTVGNTAAENLDVTATKDGKNVDLTKPLTRGTYNLTYRTTDAAGATAETRHTITVNYAAVAKPTINLIQGETLTEAEKRSLLQLQDGTSKIDVPSNARVDVTLDTSSESNGRTASATVVFADNTRTAPININYKVYKNFETVTKVYDFVGVDRNDSPSSYYKNPGGLPGGMSWVFKKGNGTLGTADNNKLKESLNADGVGTTTYAFGAKYPRGRFTDNPSEAEKLSYTPTFTHEVFDVIAFNNPQTQKNRVEVNNGEKLSATQAASAVVKTPTSQALPAGTTYEWVKSATDPTALTDTEKNVTEFGEITRYVKVTLPKVSEDGPSANRVQPYKIIPVTLKVNETVKPVVKLVGDDGQDITLTEGTEDADLPKVTVYRGEKANVTIKASDNTGKILELRGNGMPNGIWFNKDPQASREVWLSSDTATETNPLSHTITGVVETGNRIEEKIVTVIAKDKTNPTNVTTVKFKMVVKEQKEKYTPTAPTNAVNFNNLGTSVTSAEDVKKITDLVNVPDLSAEATNAGGVRKALKNNGEITTENGKKVVTVTVTYPDRSTDEVTVPVAQNYNVVARPIINFKRGEVLNDEDKRSLVQLQDGENKVDIPSDARVTFDNLDTSISENDGKIVTKNAKATITFADSTVKKVPVNYKVLNTFPIARTIYDFKDVTRSNGHSDYYSNTGNNIPNGMSWVYKQNGGAEQGGTTFTTTLASDPVGTTSYEFIGKYNYGRFTNSPSEAEKLVHKETLVHKVFDIADSAAVTVSKGATLTTDQAKAAVKKADGSDPLPEGTTYEWVESTDTNTPGKRTYKVKVTLPVSQSGSDTQPVATQARPSKTIDVTVKVKPTAPTIAPQTNGDVTITPADETNVNTLNFTYIHPNGNTQNITATKNGNTWSLSSNTPPDGVTINENTGVVTIKDRAIKDEQTVTAKSVSADSAQADRVESDITNGISPVGDKERPKFVFQPDTNTNTGEKVVEGGKQIVYVTPTESTGITIGNVTDNSGKLLEVRISDSNNRDFNLGLGSGVTTNEVTRANNTEHDAPRPVTITGTVSKLNGSNRWNNGDVLTRFVQAQDAATNGIDTQGNSNQVTFKILTQAAKYTPTVGTQLLNKDVTANGAKVTPDEFTAIKNAITFTAERGTVKISNAANNRTAGLDITMKDEGTIKHDSTGYYVEATVSYPDGTSDVVRVNVDKSDKEAPKVKLHGVELKENSTENPKFIVFRGATFNPTFEVTDNANPITSLNATGLPTGTFTKTGSMASGSRVQITENNIVPTGDALTLGEHDASVTVKDASNNEKTYNFKYIVADVEVKNTPEIVALGTKLVDTANSRNGKDAHDYVKAVVESNSTGHDKYYPTSMSFKWSKDGANVETTTAFDTPGIVKYKAVADFFNGGGTYTKTVEGVGNNIKIYAPNKIEREVTFKVQPTAPTVSQWQNGNLKVTPTTDHDKVTIPLKDSSVTLVKKAAGWEVETPKEGVIVRGDSVEIPKDLLGTTITAKGTKGTGDSAVDSENAPSYTLLSHTVNKADIIKKPTDTITEADLSGRTGVTGVTDNNVNKAYANAGITSVGFANGIPTLTPDSEQNVPVTITYNDGSKENVDVTLKVSPKKPVIKANENGSVEITPELTGEGTATISYKAEDGTSKTLTLTKATNGTWTSSDSTIPVDATGKVTLTAAQVKDESSITAQVTSGTTSLRSELSEAQVGKPLTATATNPTDKATEGRPYTSGDTPVVTTNKPKAVISSTETNGLKVNAEGKVEGTPSGLTWNGNDEEQTVTIPVTVTHPDDTAVELRVEVKVLRDTDKDGKPDVEDDDDDNDGIPDTAEPGHSKEKTALTGTATNPTDKATEGRPYTSGDTPVVTTNKPKAVISSTETNGLKVNAEGKVEGTPSGLTWNGNDEEQTVTIPVTVTHPDDTAVELRVEVKVLRDTDKDGKPDVEDDDDDNDGIPDTAEPGHSKEKTALTGTATNPTDKATEGRPYTSGDTPVVTTNKPKAVISSTETNGLKVNAEGKVEGTPSGLTWNGNDEEQTVTIPVTVTHPDDTAVELRVEVKVLRDTDKDGKPDVEDDDDDNDGIPDTAEPGHSKEKTALTGTATNPTDKATEGRPYTSGDTPVVTTNKPKAVISSTETNGLKVNAEGKVEGTPSGLTWNGNDEEQTVTIPVTVTHPDDTAVELRVEVKVLRDTDKDGKPDVEDDDDDNDGIPDTAEPGHSKEKTALTGTATNPTDKATEGRPYTSGDTPVVTTNKPKAVISSTETNGLKVNAEGKVEGTPSGLTWNGNDEEQTVTIPVTVTHPDDTAVELRVEVKVLRDTDKDGKPDVEDDDDDNDGIPDTAEPGHSKEKTALTGTATNPTDKATEGRPYTSGDTPVVTTNKPKAVISSTETNGLKVNAEGKVEGTPSGLTWNGNDEEQTVTIPVTVTHPDDTAVELRVEVKVLRDTDKDGKPDVEDDDDDNDGIPDTAEPGHSKEKTALTGTATNPTDKATEGRPYTSGDTPVVTTNKPKAVISSTETNGLKVNAEGKVEGTPSGLTWNGNDEEQTVTIPVTVTHPDDTAVELRVEVKVLRDTDKDGKPDVEDDDDDNDGIPDTAEPGHSKEKTALTGTATNPTDKATEGRPYTSGDTPVVTTNKPKAVISSTETNGLKVNAEGKVEGTPSGLTWNGNDEEQTVTIPVTVTHPDDTAVELRVEVKVLRDTDKDGKPDVEDDDDDNDGIPDTAEPGHSKEKTALTGTATNPTDKATEGRPYTSGDTPVVTTNKPKAVISSTETNGLKVNAEGKVEGTPSGLTWNGNDEEQTVTIPVTVTHPDDTAVELRVEVKVLRDTDKDGKPDVEDDDDDNDGIPDTAEPGHSKEKTALTGTATNPTDKATEGRPYTSGDTPVVTTNKPKAVISSTETNGLKVNAEGKVEGTPSGLTWNGNDEEQTVTIPVTVTHPDDTAVELRVEVKVLRDTDKDGKPDVEDDDDDNDGIPDTAEPGHSKEKTALTGTATNPTDKATEGRPYTSGDTPVVTTNKPKAVISSTETNGLKVNAEGKVEGTPSGLTWNGNDEEQTVTIPVTVTHPDDTAVELRVEVKVLRDTDKDGKPDVEDDDDDNDGIPDTAEPGHSKEKTALTGTATNPTDKATEGRPYTSGDTPVVTTNKPKAVISSTETNGLKVNAEGKVEGTPSGLTWNGNDEEQTVTIPVTVTHPDDTAVELRVEVKVLRDTDKDGKPDVEDDDDDNDGIPDTAEPGHSKEKTALTGTATNPTDKATEGRPYTSGDTPVVTTNKPKAVISSTETNGLKVNAEGKVEGTPSGLTWNGNDEEQTVTIPVTVTHPDDTAVELRVEVKVLRDTDKDGKPDVEDDDDDNDGIPDTAEPGHSKEKTALTGTATNPTDKATEGRPYTSGDTPVVTTNKPKAVISSTETNGLKVNAEGKVEGTPSGLTWNGNDEEQTVTIPVTVTHPDDTAVELRVEVKVLRDTDKDGKPDVEDDDDDNDGIPDTAEPGHSKEKTALTGTATNPTDKATEGRPYTSGDTPVVTTNKPKAVISSTETNGLKVNAEGKVEGTPSGLTWNGNDEEQTVTIPVTVTHPDDTAVELRVEVKVLRDTDKDGKPDVEDDDDDNDGIPDTAEPGHSKEKTALTGTATNPTDKATEGRPYTSGDTPVVTTNKPKAVISSTETNGLKVNAEGKVEGTPSGLTWNGNDEEQTVTIPVTVTHPDDTAVELRVEVKVLRDTDKDGKPDVEDDDDDNDGIPDTAEPGHSKEKTALTGTATNPTDKATEGRPYTSGDTPVVTTNKPKAVISSTETNGLKVNAEGKVEGTPSGLTWNGNDEEQTVTIPVTVTHPDDTAVELRVEVKVLRDTDKDGKPDVEDDDDDNDGIPDTAEPGHSKEKTALTGTATNPTDKATEGRPYTSGDTPVVTTNKPKAVISSTETNGLKVNAEGKVEGTPSGLTWNGNDEEQTVTIPVTVTHPDDTAVELRVEVKVLRDTDKDGKPDVEDDDDDNDGIPDTAEPGHSKEKTALTGTATNPTDKATEGRPYTSGDTPVVTTNKPKAVISSTETNGLKVNAEGKVEGTPSGLTWNGNDEEQTVTIPVTVTHPDDTAVELRVEVKVLRDTDKDGKPDVEDDDDDNDGIPDTAEPGHSKEKTALTGTATNPTDKATEGRPYTSGDTPVVTTNKPKAVISSTETNGLKVNAEGKVEGTPSGLTWNGNDEEQTVTIPVTVTHPDDTAVELRVEVKVLRDTDKDGKPDVEDDDDDNDGIPDTAEPGHSKEKTALTGTATNPTDKATEGRPYTSGDTPVVTTNKPKAVISSTETNGLKVNAEGKVEGTPSGLTWNGNDEEQTVTIPVTVTHPDDTAVELRVEVKVLRDTDKDGKPDVEDDDDDNDGIPDTAEPGHSKEKTALTGTATNPTDKATEGRPYTSGDTPVVTTNKPKAVISSTETNGLKVNAEGKVEGTPSGLTWNGNDEEQTVTIPVTVTHPDDTAVELRVEVKVLRDTDKDGKPDVEDDDDDNDGIPDTAEPGHSKEKTALTGTATNPTDKATEGRPYTSGDTPVVTTNKPKAVISSTETNGLKVNAEGKVEGTPSGLTWNGNDEEQTVTIPVTVTHPDDTAVELRVEVKVLRDTDKDGKPDVEDDDDDNDGIPDTAEPGHSKEKTALTGTATNPTDKATEGRPYTSGDTPVVTTNKPKAVISSTETNGLKVNAEGKVEGTPSGLTWNGNDEEQTVTIPVTVTHPDDTAVELRVEVKVLRDTDKDGKPDVEDDDDDNDGQQRPATPSDDTNLRPDTATPAEMPATQPAEQPSQTVEVPAQLPNEVSETNPSVSQPQAVLPNTGTKADRATGALGVLSLLGAFGLLFAKKKKDDEEEA